MGTPLILPPGSAKKDAHGSAGEDHLLRGSSFRGVHLGSLLFGYREVPEDCRTMFAGRNCIAGWPFGRWSFQSRSPKS